VSPLRLGGLRGKESTPSIGWEVSVSPLRSTRRRIARSVGRRSEGRGEKAQVCFSHFMVECVRVYAGLLINGRVE
jgi:hypothetical protein